MTTHERSKMWLAQFDKPKHPPRFGRYNETNREPYPYKDRYEDIEVRMGADKSAIKTRRQAEDDKLEREREARRAAAMRFVQRKR